MENIVSEIRQALKDSVDKKTQSNSQNFFKEEIKSYGVRVPLVHKISKESFAIIQNKPKEFIFGLYSEN